jgi:hypothetical protein
VEEYNSTAQASVSSERDGRRPKRWGPSRRASSFRRPVKYLH